MDLTPVAVTRTEPLSESASILDRARARVAQTEEIAVVLPCVIDGCHNLAARSDGRCARHSRIALTIEESGRRAAEKLARNQDDYADIHLQGARIAAIGGDTRPAEWALERGGTVKPPPKHESTGSGITVNVGIALPGLGL